MLICYNFLPFTRYFSTNVNHIFSWKSWIFNLVLAHYHNIIIIQKDENLIQWEFIATKMCNSPCGDDVIPWWHRISPTLQIHLQAPISMHWHCLLPQLQSTWHGGTLQEQLTTAVTLVYTKKPITYLVILPPGIPLVWVATPQSLKLSIIWSWGNKVWSTSSHQPDQADLALIASKMELLLMLAGLGSQSYEFLIGIYFVFLISYSIMH